VISCLILYKEKPGIKMVKPEAIYLAWLDCRESGLDDPYEFFLQKAKVALNDGKLLVKAARDLCG
jgi:cystathionine beta-lyase